MLQLHLPSDHLWILDICGLLLHMQVLLWCSAKTNQSFTAVKVEIFTRRLGVHADRELRCVLLVQFVFVLKCIFGVLFLVLPLLLQSGILVGHGVERGVVVARSIQLAGIFPFVVSKVGDDDFLVHQRCLW